MPTVQTNIFKVGTCSLQLLTILATSVEMKMTALTVIQMSRRQIGTGEMIEGGGTLF